MAYLTGVHVLIADAAIIFCAYVFIAIRLWFRLLHQRVSLTISDFFILIAAVELLIMMIIFIKQNEMGAIKKNPPQSPALRKLSLGTVILYDTSLYFLKFSVLWLYHIIFPIGPSKLRVALYTSSAITVACFLTATFMAIFWCGSDVSQHWIWDENGHNKCSFWNTQLFIADWAMNIGTDILILLLPFPLLTKLILSWGQVLALCITFGLGAITMVVSIFRFVSVMHHEFLPLYVWSVAEICTAIVVVSLPALRPLLRRAKSSSSTAARQTSPRSMPMRRLSAPRTPPHLHLSKSDHRSLRGDLPDGYHFAYDAEKNSSDVELHGRLKSDSHSNAETIAVYVDQPGEVLQQQNTRQLPPIHANMPPPSQIRNSHDARSWVERTRRVT